MILTTETPPFHLSSRPSVHAVQTVPKTQQPPLFGEINGYDSLHSCRNVSRMRGGGSSIFQPEVRL